MTPEAMTEDQLLDRARDALTRAYKAKPGSFARKLQLRVYDSYSDELRRRVIKVIARFPE